MDDKGKVNQFNSIDELEQKLDQNAGRGIDLYPPIYNRFDTHTVRTKRYPIELNKTPNEDHPWLLRIHYPSRTETFGTDLCMVPNF